MKCSKQRPAAFASALLVAHLCVASAAVAADTDNLPPPASVKVERAHDLAAQSADVVIVDVRTPAEFEASHISGAVNLSIEDETFSSLAAALDPQKTYIVHCTRNPVDGRSGRAIQAMESLGLTRVLSLEGGYVAWSEAQLPLTEDQDP